MYKSLNLLSRIFKKETKIFCIGMNKTGTTSLEKTFKDLGYSVANQREAELLLPHYENKNFKPIIDYCKTAQVFQDFPFSFPETYKHVDKAYPNSKFILSIRSNSEEWYNSLTNFHAAFFGNGRIPSTANLKNSPYVYAGWAWRAVNILFKTSEKDPYNKEILVKKYVDYNNEVIHYFSNRRKDLLVLNLAEKDSYDKFCNFFKLNSPFTDFPWINKTVDIKV